MLLVISFNDFITIQNGSINKCLPGLQVQPSAHQVNLVVETVTISSSVLHSDQTSGAGFIYESCQFVPFRKALSPSPPLLKWRKSCTVFLYLCLSKSLYFPPIGKWPCDAIELTENWRDRCAEASLPMWILQCVKKDSILAHKLENCSKMTSDKINK